MKYKFENHFFMCIINDHPRPLTTENPEKCRKVIPDLTIPKKQTPQRKICNPKKIHQEHYNLEDKIGIQMNPVDNNIYNYFY